MPWVRASIVSALIAFVSLALPAQAAPAPIVFDFEDGLQGWELSGSAQRVQTQVLGGEWAILGTRGAAVQIDFDAVLRINTIEFEWLFVGDADVGSLRIEFVGRCCFSFGTSTSTTKKNPTTVYFSTANPFYPRADLTGVRIIWDSGIPIIGDPSPPLPPESFVSVIDTITLRSVPEPGTLTLFAGSLVALVIARRRISSCW